MIKWSRLYVKRRGIVAAIIVTMVGSAFVVAASASTFTVHDEAENGAITGNAEKLTEQPGASGDQAAVIQFGASTSTPVPPTSSRGPNGTHWPSHTPDYTTPATTVITSLSQLNAAIAAANSGDVIEVAPQNSNQDITLTGGNVNWSKNVLVRPPLGKRQSVVQSGLFVLNAAHVTVAGFAFTGDEATNDVVRMYDGADRSAIARSTLGPQTFFGARNQSASGGVLEDAGLYEVVAATPKKSKDRMNISALGAGSVQRFTIAGAWIKGSYRATGSADHSDTLQTVAVSSSGFSGGFIKDVTVVDSVFFPSSNVAMQLANLQGTFTIRNSWLGECSTSASDVPANYDCLGYHTLTGGIATLNIHDSDFFGSINNSGTMVMYNSKAHSINNAIREGTGNTIQAGLSLPPPGLSDLDTIWQ